MVKLSKVKLKRAIKGSYGNITLVAHRCGVERLSIYNYLRKHPEFWDLLEKDRDKILDKAENNLHKAVISGDMKATEFLLKTVGSKRGYTPTQIVDDRRGSNVDASDFRAAYKSAMEQKALPAPEKKDKVIEAEFKEVSEE